MGADLELDSGGIPVSPNTIFISSCIVENRCWDAAFSEASSNRFTRRKDVRDGCSALYDVSENRFSAAFLPDERRPIFVRVVHERHAEFSSGARPRRKRIHVMTDYQVGFPKDRPQRQSL